MITPPDITYCTRCVYPSASATPLIFDENGVCSGCRTHEEQKTVDWPRRKKMFEDLIEEYRSKDGSQYDCAIAVSGGKDSFYQAHLLTKVYGLKVLFICYRENQHTELGLQNIQRMKEAFKGDFIEVTPEVSVLKRLSEWGMIQMGDPNWHTHIGIMTVPIAIAQRYGVKLFIYGEHGFMNLGGMHSYSDLVEFTRKYRTEHMCRGYDWNSPVGFKGLTEQDMLWAKYPTDTQIEAGDLRGIFISNYFGWEQDKHTQLMVDLYGFGKSQWPRDRTFLRDSNLNDVHDDGIHDYMKYVKFGYGRATDHACRQIRQGLISRPKGVEYVQNYDHVIPGDIARWCEYVGWTRTQFEEVADRFRSPKVWVKNEYGQWIKKNIWDK